MSKSILAWHFVGPRLRDGRAVPADGVKLVHSGLVKPCFEGLHASIHPFDALRYAPGETLCLVKCGGTIVPHADDKIACSERTIIARMDATPLLREFAREQALSVAHLWNPPDVVLDYLMSGDEQLRGVARDAAWAAAWGAARDAAWAAARDAAWDAAWGAAWDAARDAAWGAARGAAWAAARAAAWDAARAAAWDAFKEKVRLAFVDYLPEGEAK